MTEEKIVLTKEQAATIDWVSKNYGNSFAIRLVSTSARPYPNCWSKPETTELNELSLDELARALYVGYEVEKTQEERESDVKMWYKHYLERADEAWANDRKQDAHQYSAYLKGCSETLDLLGIKIEGVNG